MKTIKGYREDEIVNLFGGKNQKLILAFMLKSNKSITNKLLKVELDITISNLFHAMKILMRRGIVVREFSDFYMFEYSLNYDEV